MKDLETKINAMVEREARQAANIMEPLHANNRFSIMEYEAQVRGAQSLIPIIVELAGEIDGLSVQLQQIKWPLRRDGEADRKVDACIDAAEQALANLHQKLNEPGGGE